MKTRCSLIVLLIGSITVFESCKCEDEYEMDKQEFVTQASSVQMLKIKSGQLAIERNANPLVKDFGQLIVNASTANETELNVLANKKNFAVSAQLLSGHQMKFDALVPLTGLELDKAIITLLIHSLREQANLFDMASRELDDADLRMFTKQKLPDLLTQLTLAQELKARLSL